MAAPAPASSLRIDLVSSLDEKDENQTSALTRQLTRDLYAATYDCAVCSETIQRGSSLWHCDGGCYAVLHLPCMRQWSLAQAQQREQQLRSSSQIEEYSCLAKVFCPLCRAAAPESTLSRYMCYCGKTQDPRMDPMLVLGCCGEVCGRARGPFCPHRCTLLCHPGPCASCTHTREIHCFCGKSKQTDRFDYTGAQRVRPKRVCCSAPDKYFSCGEVCGKRLPCGEHTCSLPCHDGECPSCSVRIELSCFCGSRRHNYLCGSPELAEVLAEASQKLGKPFDGTGEAGAGAYSCREKCPKWRSCGEHRCEVTCHPGPCQPCLRDPSRQRCCPCGKVRLTSLSSSSESPAMDRTRCTDRIPTCGLVCEAPLPCGHTCWKECHDDAYDMYEHGEKVASEAAAAIKKPDEPAARSSGAPPSLTEEALNCVESNKVKSKRKGPKSSKKNALLDFFAEDGGPAGQRGRRKDKGKAAQQGADDEGVEPNLEEREVDPALLHQLGCGCGPCKELVPYPCRCGHTELKIPCFCLTLPPEMWVAAARVTGIALSALPINRSLPPQCSRPCRTMLSCKKHRCSETCCIDTDHFCGQICIKKLSCGQHQCGQLCHTGPCGACTNTSYERLFCRCRKTWVEPPVPCGTLIPKCEEPCIIPRPCGHPAYHACHTDAVDCPPCVVLVEKTCASHAAPMPYYMACHLKDVVCGKRCGKKQTCCDAVCEKTCHSGPCIHPCRPKTFKDVVSAKK